MLKAVERMLKKVWKVKATPHTSIVRYYLKEFVCPQALLSA